MFCYQCEQTFQAKGCSDFGVCGKTETSAVLQDLIIYVTKGISIYAEKAREYGVIDPKADLFVLKALFATVTNVNFDDEKLEKIIRDSIEVRNSIKEQFLTSYEEKTGREFGESLPIVTNWQPAETTEELLAQGNKVGILTEIQDENEDIRSLRQLLLYGIKGMAAYADHALILGKTDEEVMSFIHKGMAALANYEITADELLSLSLECGKANFKVMEILDAAHTEKFGHPIPTSVPLGAKEGPAILVSGHDLHDLELLLEQTEGKNVTIYTHGEMLPAHGYPELKKYKQLYGNYGGAWQDQIKEFAQFPGAILMTTNCIQKPQESYFENIFTTGNVAWPGVKHISEDKDFTPVIEKAIEMEGYPIDIPNKEIMVGFGHNAVLGVADKVVDAVKEGAIKHFFLIGGCDGAKYGRNYFTDFAQKAPEDSVILTLACGKYRFNKFDFGDIGGIPRLLDVGQCNDAYSAIKIAVALSEAFDCGVNDLPLSLIISWYEQKAVAILLTLLHLGIKNIKLGPSLPAFITPNVLNILVENYAIAPITDAEADIENIMQPAEA